MQIDKKSQTQNQYARMIEFLETLYMMPNPQFTINPIKFSGEKKQSLGKKFNTLKNLLPVILNINETQKAEAFYMPNTSNTGGTKNEEITTCYTVFIDIDNKPLPKLFALDPSAIISREDGNSHHVYWFIEPTQNINLWGNTQEILINFYNSDPQIKNTNRLMRLPETYRYKNNARLKFSLMKLCSDRYDLNSVILAHSNSLQAEEKIKNILKNIAPKEKIKDGEGRAQFMVKTVFLAHDYNLSEESTKKTAEWVNENFFEDTYTEAELLHRIEAQKYAKNEKGVKQIEHTLQDAKRIEDCRELLKHWYYVHTENKFVNILAPHKRPKTKENFNLIFSASTKTANAVQYITRHDIIKHAEQLVYEPEKDKLIQEDDLYINIWKKSELDEIKKTPIWFIEHIKYLFPNPKDHDYLLDFFAHTIQKPREKIRHAVILIGGQGIGKSILVQLFKRLLGSSNVTEPHNENIADRFTGWAKQCQLCFIHEIKQQDKISFINKIKPFITEDFIEIRQMYTEPYTIKNYMNIIATTNEDYPINLDRDDRRWMILQSDAIQKEKEYYVELINKIQNNAGEVLHFLKQRDLSNFFAGDRPPITNAKRDIIANSQGELESWIDDHFEEKIYPFDGDIVSVNMIQNELPIELKSKFNTNKRIARYLRRLRIEIIETQVRIDNGITRFYVLKNIAEWKQTELKGTYQKEVHNYFKNQEQKVFSEN